MSTELMGFVGIALWVMVLCAQLRRKKDNRVAGLHARRTRTRR